MQWSGCWKRLKSIGKSWRYVSGGSDIEVERKMQHWATALQARAGVDKGQMRVMECGLRWAVEARRRGRREEQ